MRRALLLLLLAGCTSQSFRPDSLVTELRVLGLRAEPAELRPGESASLSALVVDPSRPGKRNTVLWIGCDPDPFNSGRSACSDTSALQSLGNLSDLSKLPPGVRLLGLDSAATYAVKADLYAPVPAGDPVRQSGTVGQVLAIAVGDEVSPTATMAELQALFARIQAREVKAIITLFRIPVSERAAVNRNPAFSTFLLRGERLAPGATVLVKPDETASLGADAPDAAFEPFSQVQPDGSRVDKTDRLLSSWYSTTGRFEPFARLALRTDGVMDLLAPGPTREEDPVPEDRRGTLWAVLRDSRGGNGWASSPLYLCDPARPAPVVQAVAAPASRGEPLVLTGSDLGEVLDVLLDGVPALRVAARADGARLVADVPPEVPPGSYALRLATTNCERPALPSPLVVP